MFYAPLAVDFPLLKRPFVSTLYGQLDHVTYIHDGSNELWKTDPYTHRPLVEYVLAVPLLALYSPFAYRAGMKKALKDVLAPGVLSRNDKVLGQVVASRSGRQTDEEFEAAKVDFRRPKEWQIVSRGYAEPAVLARALEMRFTEKPMTAGYLRACVEIEAWLMTLAKRDHTPGRAWPEPVRVSTGSTLEVIGR